MGKKQKFASLRVPIIVPIPTLVGREELYTQLGFFVQSILADRYVHRRELWVVSLESTYIQKHRNKKHFRISFFYSELLRFEIVWIIDSFDSHFLYFSLKIGYICKYK